MKIAEAAYQSKEVQYTPELIRQVEKMVLLGTIDHLWKDHLLAMDHMRDGIGLQGYGQKDPLVEYKKQGFKFFEMMMSQITGDVVRKIFAVQITAQNRDQLEQEIEGEEIEEAPIKNQVDSLAPTGRLPSAREALTQKTGNMSALRQMPMGVDLSKVGRNDECPCGSGKKFKKCHGVNL